MLPLSAAAAAATVFQCCLLLLHTVCSFPVCKIYIEQLCTQANPDLIYVCDPVMGDRGKLYVPEELVEVYREEMLSLATMLTPNQFEAEQLTERKIRSEADAVAACEALHARGPHTIFLTSFEPESVEAGGEQGVRWA